MTKHSRLITALLALIFCFSAITVFSVPAFAESQASQGSETPGGDAPAVDPEPVYTDPITPEPEPVYTDPVTPEPVYTEPPYVDPGSGGNSGGENSGGGNSDGGSSGSSDSSGSGTVYYDSDGNEHSDQSDVYVGGGQSYDPPVSTAPSVPLVKTESNIDVNELSKNDWNDIKKSLEKASKGTSSDGDDFSFIQKNTAKEDNGHLVLVIGIGMIVLSLAGFVYLIVSAIMRRKKIAAGGVSHSSGSHAAGAPRYRSDNDYDDGYSRASKNASKYDTADIPKAKPKGGKRYK